MRQSLSHTDIENIAPLLLDVAELMAKYTDTYLKQLTGIGVSQYRVLRAVKIQPRCTQKAIALRLSQTEASISRQIELMSEHRLLTVHRDPDDRRARIVVLTPRGADTLEQLEQHVRQLSHELLRHTSHAMFSRELHHLHHALNLAATVG